MMLAPTWIVSRLVVEFRKYPVQSVTEKVPTAVGVPLIAPVELLIASPGGRLLAVND
jgi:hypothetical protein